MTAEVAPAPVPEFTRHWFSQFIPVWNKLLDDLRPGRILEIGSFEGQSACYLIGHCAAHRPVEIHCIDDWSGGRMYRDDVMSEVERRFDRNTALAARGTAHPVGLHKHRQRSDEVLPALLVEGRRCTFDLAYIDGSHDAPDVLSDAVDAFRLLRPGGLMIFDDYLWNFLEGGRHDPLRMPKPAIDAFLNIFQRHVQIVHGAPIGQLYVHKISDRKGAPA